MATFYIQRRDSNGLETVDQFNSGREARKMRNEYAIADYSGHYYVSRKPCKAWVQS